MPTKRTLELQPGDVVLVHHADARGYVLASGDWDEVEHVEPWMLTRGPYAGQQARNGRGNTGDPLYTVRTRGGALHARTADDIWNLKEN